MKCQPNLLRREPCHIWQLTMNTSDCACWVAYRNWSYPFLLGTLQLTYSHGFFFLQSKKSQINRDLQTFPILQGVRLGRGHLFENVGWLGGSWGFSQSWCFMKVLNCLNGSKPIELASFKKKNVKTAHCNTAENMGKCPQPVVIIKRFLHLR